MLYVGAASASSTLTDKAGQCAVLLQLAEDWVIQRSSDRSQLLSAFRCDYERQFEILRKMSQVTPSIMAGPEPARLARRHPLHPQQGTRIARGARRGGRPAGAAGDVRQDSEQEIHRAAGFPHLLQGHQKNRQGHDRLRI